MHFPFPVPDFSGRLPHDLFVIKRVSIKQTLRDMFRLVRVGYRFSRDFGFTWTDFLLKCRISSIYVAMTCLLPGVFYSCVDKLILIFSGGMSAFLGISLFGLYNVF